MNQEYKIVTFRIDLKEYDKSVFLPVGALILEVYYEALRPDMSMVYLIGGLDRLILFRALKDEMENLISEHTAEEIFGTRMGLLAMPDPRKFTEIRMVIKALVPAPKQKGKYA